MKITITGKHLEVGDSLRAHVESALKAVVNRYFGDILESHITIAKDTYLFRTDLSVHVSRNFIVRAHAEDQDAYRSTDLAIEKLEARIGRHKTRLKDVRRKHDDSDSIWSQQYVLNSATEEYVEDQPLIIAETAHEIPTLSVGDAVMQLDLSDVPAMMFKNPASGHLNIVYRRPDGHIGWVDPKSPGK